MKSNFELIKDVFDILGKIEELGQTSEYINRTKHCKTEILQDRYKHMRRWDNKQLSFYIFGEMIYVKKVEGFWFHKYTITILEKTFRINKKNNSTQILKVLEAIYKKINEDLQSLESELKLDDIRKQGKLKVFFEKFVSRGIKK